MTYRSISINKHSYSWRSAKAVSFSKSDGDHVGESAMIIDDAVPGEDVRSVGGVTHVTHEPPT